MIKLEMINDRFLGDPTISIQDYHWMITLKSDGKIEFFDSEMDGIFTPDLDPTKSLFAQIYEILEEHEIDQWSDDQSTPAVFIRCGEMIYLWEFTLAHYCFAKNRLSEQNFREAIEYAPIAR